jgi:hypothetical protein
MYQYGYNQVVTQTNLEQVIHLYEQQPSSAQQQFTKALGEALVQKLQGLTLATQLAVGQQLLASFHTKDVQIYLADPHAEAVLASHHVDGAFPPPPADSVSLVDANVTLNKGSHFLTVAETDNVGLDARGTATHTLIITYDFLVKDAAELYGSDEYRTYLRLYAPADAKLLSQQGFTNLNGDDQFGHTDQTGYQMWGGYLLVHDGMPYTLHLTWQVPSAAVRGANGQHTYTLAHTRQAGLQQTLNTTITLPGASHPAYHSQGPLDADQYITLSY